MISQLRTAAMILLILAMAGTAFAQMSGEAIYKAKCASCHGADGQAATAMGKTMKVLPFKDPAMLKASYSQFFAATRNGKGKMPAYNGKLTDAQIKDVTEYIRTLQK